MQMLSTVTSKGQILIPVSIRKSLQIEPRDRVTFRLSNKFFVVEKAPTVEQMFGFIKTKKQMTDKQLEKEIARATEKGITEDL